MFVPSETDSTKGDLYYNGELVKFFTDPNPNGDFSFYSETEGSNLSLYITYHNDGTMDKLNTTTLSGRTTPSQRMRGSAGIF